MDLGSDFVPFS
ncbi:hypothetical protein YPPY66_2860, partial [Yersinia pestis PY-66]